MSRVEAIEEEVQKLSTEELAAFLDWFAQFDVEEWDRELEADVEAGKLDSLAARALAQREAGDGPRR